MLGSLLFVRVGDYMYCARMENSELVIRVWKTEERRHFYASRSAPYSAGYRLWFLVRLNRSSGLNASPPHHDG